MLNWRRHVFELAATALVAIALSTTVSLGLILVSGTFDYLLPAMFGVLGYGLIVGVAWVGFTAMFSWLLRRRSHWSSILAGGCASLVIAAGILAPLVVSSASTGGWGDLARVPITLVAGAVVVMALIQTVIHLVLRARHRGEVATELS